MLNKQVLNEYEFDYGSKVKKFFSDLMGSFCNISAIFWFLFALFYAFAELLNLINNSNLLSVIRFIYFFINAFIILYCIITLTKSKKIILYQDMIFVRKNTIFGSPFFIHKGIFNQKILFKNIVYCDYSEYIPFGYQRRGNDYAVSIFNWDSLVKIKDKSGHKYYIPVKNADDFIDEVNLYAERARFFSKLNIDLLLKNKGLSYNDLNVRWKSKDEIDSIYYTDNMGNKVELIKY